MILEQLANEIKHLNYVIQRNWEELPRTYEMDGHGDLDIFVSDEDRAELELKLEPYKAIIPMDVRSPRDLYYPPYIAEILLETRRLHGGFWVPSAEGYFLSLTYHAYIHKERNGYESRLKKIFQEWIPATKCTDPGVGYFT